MNKTTINNGTITFENQAMIGHCDSVEMVGEIYLYHEDFASEETIKVIAEHLASDDTIWSKCASEVPHEERVSEFKEAFRFAAMREDRKFTSKGLDHEVVVKNDGSHLAYAVVLYR